MELSKCLVCLKDCFPLTTITKTEEIVDGIPNDSNPVQRQLDIIFLLKKILVIPENVFSEFSQKYGDPHLWIDCCESCSVLVKKLSQLSSEIMLLEEQFKKLQNTITGKIVHSNHSESFENCFNSEAKKTVRSYVCQAFGDTIEVPSENVKVEDVQNSSECIIGYQSFTFQSSDNEFSDIDSDDDEEKHVYDKIDELPHNLNVEIENPITLPEIDYGRGDTLVIKEEEQSTYTNEREEMQEIAPCEIIHLDSGTKYVKEIRRGLEILKCTKCCKAFTTEEKLFAHLCKNNSEKRFSCEMCDKQFKYSAKLQEHVRTHTAERPFKCELCEKRFSQISNLKRHVKTVHYDERPFKCELCEKRFSEMNRLRLHVKAVHYGEKSFKCEFCEKRYFEKRKLRLHLKTFHNG